MTKNRYQYTKGAFIQRTGGDMSTFGADISKLCSIKKKGFQKLNYKQMKNYNENNSQILSIEEFDKPIKELLSSSEEKKSCSYKGQTYSHGSKICINGNEHYCHNGKWIDGKTSC